MNSLIFGLLAIFSLLAFVSLGKIKASTKQLKRSDRIKWRRYRDKDLNEESVSFDEIEKRIVQLLEEKIRPAIARDGGDIKFKEFKNGVVKVQLQLSLIHI